MHASRAATLIQEQNSGTPRGGQADRRAGQRAPSGNITRISRAADPASLLPCTAFFIPSTPKRARRLRHTHRSIQLSEIAPTLCLQRSA
jgi:hypothetical protein